MKITLLGAGNVATQLALSLRKAGHQLVQIYNRSSDAGSELARTVGATFTSDIRALAVSDIFIMAIKDDAIADLASQFNVEHGIVVHTSGTKTKDLLKFTASHYGVFYPLQTMTKLAKLDFTEVPILIEADDEETRNKLRDLAASISKQTFEVQEDQRQWIHLAAVLANNFTNHLYALSEMVLKDHGLSFEILKPLIFKATENLHQYTPAQLQTGPAVRGDQLTIERHLQLLADRPDLGNLYRTLTESILRYQTQ